MHEAAQKLLALLQRPDLQDLAESPQVGHRVGRGGLQVDRLVVDALQVGEAGFEGLTLVAFDYHYWLQRGSLEVEKGDLKLAEQFLDQARSLAPEDYLVQTAYAYLMMRRATEYPSRQHAKEYLEDGIGILEEVISEHGNTTPYPFHVLGNQGLAWAKYGGTLEGVAKRVFLERLQEVVKRGLELHPWSRELRDLSDVLKKETLLTVVRPANT